MVQFSWISVSSNISLDKYLRGLLFLLFQAAVLDVKKKKENHQEDMVWPQVAGEWWGSFNFDLKNPGFFDHLLGDAVTV